MTKSVNLYLASGVSDGIGFWIINFTDEENIFNTLVKHAKKDRKLFYESRF